MTLSNHCEQRSGRRFRQPRNERLLWELNQWQTFQIYPGHTGRYAGERQDLLRLHLTRNAGSCIHKQAIVGLTANLDVRLHAALLAFDPLH